jgi:uncharacterized protein (DUF1330 family)
MGLTLVVIARIPVGGLERYERYEEAVLPLIAEHGGRLERRLRGVSGEVEVHVVSFASADAFAAYRADPRRERHAPLLAASGARVEVLEVEDVRPTAPS